MPRFAANLAYLFTEWPFRERFGAAAAAGFPAVELQAPYEHPPSLVKAELAKHKLTMLGINTPPGASPGGESGVAAIPGRELEFAALFRHALDYAAAIGGRTVHVLAGKVPPHERPAAEKTFVKNLAVAAELAADRGIRPTS
jgi:2-dehydrotetronate isomerase